MVYTIEKEHAHYRELKKSNDRCDRCGVEATFRAIKLIDKKLLEVLLCGHHFRANSYKLGLDGWLIQGKTED